MSEDPAVRAPIRRIKIKFGNKLVSTHDVRIPGLGSSTSQDSKDAKSGSALQLAKLRQTALKGYVPPSATADAIVARLRDGEGFAPGSELPPWDFTAPLIASCEERPVKRARQLLQCAEEDFRQSCPGPCTDAATGPVFREGFERGPAEAIVAEAGAKVEAALEPTAIVAFASGESNSDQATNSQVYLPLSPDGATEGAARGWPAAAASGRIQTWGSSAVQSYLATATQPEAAQPQRKRSSTTENPQATASQPDESVFATSFRAVDPKAITAAASPSAVAAPPLPRSRSLGRATAASCSPSPGSATRGEGPSTSGRQQLSQMPVAAPKALAGVSVDTQTPHGDFPLLPLSFLELPRLCGTALSFQSIGPFDLQLEREQPVVLTDAGIEGLIAEARRVKHEGDDLSLMKNPNQRHWTMKALSKYITASLLFMEAADAMVQRRELKYNVRGGTELYRRTAEMLATSVSIAENLRGNGIGKEGIRLLAERLCAVCLMRCTSLMGSTFKACADRAQNALRAHQKQQAAQGQGAAAVPSRNGQQPSPEDSSISSLHAVHAGGNGGGTTAQGGPGGATASGGGSSFAAPQPLAGFNHEQVLELINYTQTTCRFSEYMKRSCKSFEAFLERPDVRQNQQAKLLCMHLAAVCMDVGMTPGLRMLRHAHEALRTLCEDLAR